MKNASATGTELWTLDFSMGPYVAPLEPKRLWPYWG